MALINSDCDVMRDPNIKWPQSPRIARPSGEHPELYRRPNVLTKLMRANF